MARRQHLTLTVVLAFLGFMTFTWFMSSSNPAGSDPFSVATQYDTTESLKKGSSGSSLSTGSVDFGLGDSILGGGAIAPRLGNETAKYVLLLKTILEIREQIADKSTNAGVNWAVQPGNSSTR